jgi:hypothetical protein
MQDIGGSSAQQSSEFTVCARMMNARLFGALVRREIDYDAIVPAG